MEQQRQQEQYPLPPSASSEPSSDAFYQSLESYPWHTDAEFQSGLRAILGPDNAAGHIEPSDPSQAAQADLEDPQTQDLTLRARCFYYSRKYNLNVDFEPYRAWREQQSASRLSSLAPSSVAVDDSSLPSSTENTPRKNAGPSDRGAVNGIDGVIGGGSVSQPEQQQQNVTQGQVQAAEELPSYPPSFATIMELIKSGQPIPGIKDIPDTVLVGQASEATKDRRRKPWEERLRREEAGDASGASEGSSSGGGDSYGGYFGAPPEGNATFGEDSASAGTLTGVGEAQ